MIHTLLQKQAHGMEGIEMLPWASAIRDGVTQVELKLEETTDAGDGPYK